MATFFLEFQRLFYLTLAIFFNFIFKLYIIVLVLPKEHTGHNTTTQEMSLHMDITQMVNTKIRLIFFFAVEDGVSKNKTGS